MTQPRDITKLLRAAAGGDEQSRDELYRSVYDELYGIAKRQRRRWSGNETINTLALLNEAYLKLSPDGQLSFNDRAHFFATAARAMRQVLLNYAERASAGKRGAGAIRLTWSEDIAMEQDAVAELMQIDACLKALQQRNERHARVFECRVFGGMTVEDTASALGISNATVKRDWQFASSWVYACVNR